MTLRQAGGRWNNPLKTIEGKKCRVCGKPATHAVLTTSILPACEDCARDAKGLGYDVTGPEMAELQRPYQCDQLNSYDKSGG